MECREFRRKHVAFVDDTLPIVEMDVMRGHLRRCDSCARHDMAVRRSLMVARSLPIIQPSADFMARLEARLRTVEPLGGGAPHSPGASLRAFSGVAAGVALVALLAYAAVGRLAGPAEIRMAPVIASLPELPPAPEATPTFVASVSTGLSIWPALLTIEQGQLHLADLEHHAVNSR